MKVFKKSDIENDPLVQEFLIAGQSPMVLRKIILFVL